MPLRSTELTIESIAVFEYTCDRSAPLELKSSWRLTKEPRPERTTKSFYIECKRKINSKKEVSS